MCIYKYIYIYRERERERERETCVCLHRFAYMLHSVAYIYIYIYIYFLCLLHVLADVLHSAAFTLNIYYVILYIPYIIYPFTFGTAAGVREWQRVAAGAAGGSECWQRPPLQRPQCTSCRVAAGAGSGCSRWRWAQWVAVGRFCKQNICTNMLT